MAWKSVLDYTPSNPQPSNYTDTSFNFQVPSFGLPLHACSPLVDLPLFPSTPLESRDSEVPQPSSASSSPLPVSTADFSDLIQVIETNFNPSLKENLTPPYPRDPDFDRYSLTEQERKKASLAVVASSISDFSTKVCLIQSSSYFISETKQFRNQLKAGYKDHADAYIKLDSGLLDR